MDKRARFTALLHHVTVDLLRDSFLSLKRQAAPGIDGVTWKQYEVDLESRLCDLHGRVHRGAYRAQPSRRNARGDVVIVRYADDFVMGFQHRDEAERFLNDLRERFTEFGLALHPDKTRLIEFGRFAAENRRQHGERKPETFDFLGFTHICGRKPWSGGFIVKRQTMAKRLRAKLREVRAALLRGRHAPIAQQGQWLRRVVQGFLNYHAISGNMAALQAFRTEAVCHWLFALRRRSQRSRMPWKRFSKIADRWIPKPRILHPFPNIRFFAKHPR